MNKYNVDIPKEGTFILVLGSKWCRSCKILSTIMNKFKKEGILKFKEIDIGDDSSLAISHGIASVPALIFFKDGKRFNNNIKKYGEYIVKHGVLVGTFSETILREIIDEL
ncbi:MAG: thioredoxin family protein [Promethearchaeota archaeon]